MIFWTVVTTIGGGIAYDKYEQKQMRKKWMDAVKQFGEVSYGANEIPVNLLFLLHRLLTIFDESLKLFRKFIKPVLNAGVVDFEIFSESRQGDIRASVAEKIRELRRKQLVEETPKKNESNGNQDNDEEELKSRSDLYKAKDVLGFI